MYDDPAVIVLDEPNSNLDDVGEMALVKAVIDLRSQGKTIVLITHRTSALNATTKLLVLRDGQVAMFGPTAKVIAAMNEANQKQALAQKAAGQPGNTPSPQQPPSQAPVATQGAATPATFEQGQ